MGSCPRCTWKANRSARYCANCGLRLAPSRMAATRDKPGSAWPWIPILIIVALTIGLAVGTRRSSRSDRPHSTTVEPTRPVGSPRYSMPDDGGFRWDGSQPYNPSDPTRALQQQPDWYRRYGIPDPAGSVRNEPPSRTPWQGGPSSAGSDNGRGGAGVYPCNPSTSPPTRRGYSPTVPAPGGTGPRPVTPSIPTPYTLIPTSLRGPGR